MGGAAVVGLAVGAGLVVEALTGLPAVVAGLVLLTAALVASPRLLEVVTPVAGVLLRVLPALFVPLCAGVVGVGGAVRSSWPAALAAVAVSVPAGFVVTARLAPSLDDAAVPDDLVVPDDAAENGDGGVGRGGAGGDAVGRDEGRGGV